MKTELIEFKNIRFEELYGFLQNIPAEENGFTNKIRDKSKHEALEIVEDMISDNQKDYTIEERVPSKYYLFYVEKEAVGYVKLRFKLNEKLLIHGGNVGYSIANEFRGRGYGKLMLNAVLKKIKKSGLQKVLLTCSDSNVPSYKIIESCGGKLQDMNDGVRRYWIEL